MHLWNLWWRQGGRGILFLLLFTVLSCGGSHEESQTTPTNAPGQPAVQTTAPERTAGQSSVTPPASTLPQESGESPTPTFSSHATVLAGKEVGLAITGKGAGESARSLEVLEQQILSFLPQLQEVYEQDREQDPNLMGSLDVSLTLAPGGEVSDLRFPLRRVSSEKLIASVFDRMRAWSFPPADEEVQLRFRVLVVPPGVDQASILTWEKQLGSRVQVDRSDERRVATAAAPIPAKKAPPRISRAVSPRPRAAEAPRVPVTGWYQVVNPSVLRAAPRASSPMVIRLRPGTRVRVVGLVGGQWLEVRSISNRPPGFLYRADARPEPDQRARR